MVTMKRMLINATHPEELRVALVNGETMANVVVGDGGAELGDVAVAAALNDRERSELGGVDADARTGFNERKTFGGRADVDGFHADTVLGDKLLADAVDPDDGEAAAVEIGEVADRTDVLLDEDRALQREERGGEVGVVVAFGGLAEGLEEIEFTGAEAGLEFAAGHQFTADMEVHDPGHGVEEIDGEAGGAAVVVDVAVGEAVVGGADHERAALGDG